MRDRGREPTGVIILVAAFGFVAAVVGAAYLLFWPDEAAEAPPIAPPGVYIEGVVGTWQRISPLFAATNGIDEDLVQLLFSGLVRIGPDGSVVPDLAELPEISEGGRVYTFHLRDGLLWHDGRPITARDVAFTVQRITDPDFRGDPALVEAWTGVQVEPRDERTVVVTLRQANAPFLARTATLAIVPEHLLSGLTAAQIFDAPLNRAPVGSGPYRLQSLDTREAVLVANQTYHFGTPAINTVRIRFYPDTPSTIRALEAREIQGAFFREHLSADERAQLAAVQGLNLSDVQRAAQILLYLNNDQVIFSDLRVRRALSLALDRALVFERALEKGGLVSSSPTAPGSWAYAAEYDRGQTDAQEAARLLAEAGWERHPVSNILVRQGAEFRFTIRTDNDPIRVRLGTEIAAKLEPLGIRASVASTTFAVLQKDFLQERRYDAAIAGWDQGPDPDPYFGWHSSQRGTAGLNIANFSDLVVDELIAKARTSVDIEVRRDLYRQYQEKWAQLTPSIVLGYPSYVYARVEGIEAGRLGLLANPAQRFFDIQRWTN